MDDRNNRYDENVETFAELQVAETRLFNVTGNFWVDALILSIVPWLLVGLESNKRLKFVWWKACLVGLAALLLANFSFGNLLGIGTDYKDKYFTLVDDVKVIKSDMDSTKTKLKKVEKAKKDAITDYEFQLKSLKLQLKESEAYGKLSDEEKASKKAEEERIKKEAEKESKEIEKKLKAEKEKAKKEELKKSYTSWIKSQFSAWDGSCTLLKNEIKANLEDPDSFKHVESVYWEQSDYKTVVVKTTFRCKNVYGAVVTNTAKCTLVRDGNGAIVENFSVSW
jgi:hypothetical protein